MAANITDVYVINVLAKSNCEDIMFDGQVQTEKRINLLYDDVARHYHVIVNITGAMAKRYICKACNKLCCSDVTHKCEQACSDCMSVPPCTFSHVRIPCELCNRNFRSRTCFDKHKTNKLRGKTVCEQKKNCAACGSLLTNKKKHECNKPYCANCKRYMEVGHLCYMATLKNELPRSDNVLFVFYDFETTQHTKITETATLHIPNLVCLQQYCSRCEMLPDIEDDCERCGRRQHAFWDDPIGDLLSYLCEPRPWVSKFVAIAHNAKAFDSQFILNRAIQMKWKPELILNGLKIVSMKIQHMLFIDSVSYLPMPLRKLPEAFGLSVTKSWYPHYFNTNTNLNYVGPIPDVSYYGVDEMSISERGEYMTWYEGKKNRFFDNKLVLEKYCQDDVTVLRQACQIFRRKMQYGLWHPCFPY